MDNHLYGLIIEDLFPLFWYEGDPLPKLEDYKATVCLLDYLDCSLGYHTKTFIPLPDFKDLPDDYSLGWNDCLHWILNQDRLRKDIVLSNNESFIEDI